MQLVSLQMKGSETINGILSLNWRHLVQNGIFWTIGKYSYFVYYPIISYLRIKVYRVGKMDTGISHWKNGVSGNILLEQWCNWKMK